MDKIIEQLKNVPPVPDGICDAVLEESSKRVHRFIPYSVAALLLLSVSLFFYTKQETDPMNYVGVEESLLYSDDFVYDLYYDSYYDPLDDL